MNVFIDVKKGCYFLLNEVASCMESGTRKGFSSQPTTGASTRKYKNQYAVPILPSRIQMPSAGIAPTYISKKKSPTRNHVNCFHKGLNTLDLILLVSNHGNKAITPMADTIAITPPNLSGIALSTAYQGKKYHSGTICAGVTIGLAFM